MLSQDPGALGCAPRALQAEGTQSRSLTSEKQGTILIANYSGAEGSRGIMNVEALMSAPVSLESD